MNRLRKILTFGQSVWCDNVDRQMIRTGVFARMIEEDGLRGVTSNPTIFEKAVQQSSDYDADLRTLGEKGLSPEEIYWTVVIRDIQDVADIFLPVFNETRGLDGFVSIEVSPLLARDTPKTIRQAAELWKRVNRPNIMVKIPATLEGLSAITATIAAGINVNVTLIFSIERYREVMNAYVSGLEERLRSGGSILTSASVASFFVSRVDTETDRRLEEKIGASHSENERTRLKNLRGKAAVANSKIAYEEFEKFFAGGRFKALEQEGARVQRPLWASTSTKNAAYRDCLYVEELIGPHTVNTLPPATLEAFRDHGAASPRLKEKTEEAHRVLEELGSTGVDFAQVTRTLEEAGVKAFSDSYNKLIDCIKAKEIQIGVRVK